jgi:hypothetical protein
MIRFEVSGVDEGVSTTVARKLREKLIEEGADPDDLTMGRKNENHMDWGTLLQLAMSVDPLAVAEKGLTILAISHSIYDIVRRHGVTITVDSDGQKVEIKPSVVSVDEVQSAVEKAVRRDDGPR